METPRGRLQSPWLGAWIVVATIAGGLLALWLLPAERFSALLSESGPVEQASWLAYFIATAAVAFGMPAGTPWRLRIALALVTLGFGLRELDLHKALADTSILRLSFYWSDAPLATRLLAAAVLLPILGAALWLVVRHALPVWRAARRGRPAAITLLTFALAIVASKLLDRSLNAIDEWFAIASPPQLYALQAAIEEPMELALPLLLLLALLQHRRAP